MLSTADGGKQAPYSQQKASLGVGGGYPEGCTRAALVRQPRRSVPRLGFSPFLCFFQGRTAESSNCFIPVPGTRTHILYKVPLREVPRGVAQERTNDRKEYTDICLELTASTHHVVKNTHTYF